MCVDFSLKNAKVNGYAYVISIINMLPCIKAVLVGSYFNQEEWGLGSLIMDLFGHPNSSFKKRGRAGQGRVYENVSWLASN